MRQPNKPHWPFVLNAGCSQAQGLVGWWPGGPSGGPRLFDMSGRGNHGALTNMAFTDASGWCAGKDGGKGALSFDGTNDFVDCGASVPAQSKTSPMSISAWVYPRALTATDLIVGRWVYLTSSGWVLQCVSGSVWFGMLNSNAANSIVASTSATISTNTLYHIVATYDGSAAWTGNKIYWNGESKTTANAGGGTADPGTLTASNFTIGKREATGLEGYWNGTIEDVRLYNRVLSAAEVAAMYDPATRWQLRYQPARVAYFLPTVAGGPFPHYTRRLMAGGMLS